MSGSDSPTFFHGQPWSSWIERIGRDKPLSDDEPESEPSSSVTRLSVDDIDLYGFCPERDTFYGVVCEICNAIVKPQALIQHMECRHPSGTGNLPPPSNPIAKPTVKTPYCKLSKLKKAPSTPQLPVGNKVNNHTPVKRSTDQGSLHTSLPFPSPQSPLESISIPSSNYNSANVASTSPVKSPGTTSGQPKRKRLKADRSLLKDREYDPDRHCGVWIEETGKPCTRSLTCKAHTVSLRRTVLGRSKTFDKLLAEHRAAKELPSRQTKLTVTGTVTVSSSDATNLNALAPSTPVSNSKPEVPSSPPVLSLPDTYPLPQAVDLLYRCLAPHGSTKPNKLDENFVSDELQLESSSSSSFTNSTSAPSSTMAPISVVLPSLSPLPTGTDGSIVATLIPASTSPSSQASQLPATQATATARKVNTTDATLDDINAVLYSTLLGYKEADSQAQITRPNNDLIQQPVRSGSYTTGGQLTMSSLNAFDSLEHGDQRANGMLIVNCTNNSSPTSRHATKNKRKFPQEFPTSIQLEATACSHFNDISWSSCHPEPLAVSRWLRITSSRKQYNFNIH